MHFTEDMFEQAEDNNVSLTEDELSRNKGVIIDLRSYLKTQKRIFAAAAQPRYASNCVFYLHLRTVVFTFRIKEQLL